MVKIINDNNLKEMGEGWRIHLELFNTYAAQQKVANFINLSNIKEKFGSLRISVSSKNKQQLEDSFEKENNFLLTPQEIRQFCNILPCLHTSGVAYNEPEKYSLAVLDFEQVIESSDSESDKLFTLICAFSTVTRLTSLIENLSSITCQTSAHLGVIRAHSKNSGYISCSCGQCSSLYASPKLPIIKVSPLSIKEVNLIQAIGGLCDLRADSTCTLNEILTLDDKKLAKLVWKNVKQEQQNQDHWYYHFSAQFNKYKSIKTWFNTNNTNNDEFFNEKLSPFFLAMVLPMYICDNKKTFRFPSFSNPENLPVGFIISPQELLTQLNIAHCLPEYGELKAYTKEIENTDLFTPEVQITAQVFNSLGEKDFFEHSLLDKALQNRDNVIRKI